MGRYRRRTRSRKTCAAGSEKVDTATGAQVVAQNHDARCAAAQLKDSGLKSTVAPVLRLALEEEAQRHVGAAIDLLAEKDPCEAMYQAAGALHSPDPIIRAQGLESLQCLGDNELSRGIAELVDQAALNRHGQGMKTAEMHEALALLAHDATPWLRECIEAFVGENEGNGRPGYAV